MLDRAGQNIDVRTDMAVVRIAVKRRPRDLRRPVAERRYSAVRRPPVPCEFVAEIDLCVLTRVENERWIYRRPIQIDELAKAV